MGSPSIPAQPAPPDYAAANKGAIETDISTLPLRNQINQAAQLGQRVEYTDPVTGQKKVADFTGMGNAAAAQQAASILADTNAQMQRQQLALRQELGTGNVQQTIAELKAADPAGYALRQQLTGSAAAGLGQPGEFRPNANLASAENRLWNMANAAPGADTGRLEALYQQAAGLKTNADDAGANAKLGALEDVARTRLGTRGEDATARSRLGSIYDDATRLPTEFTDVNTLALQPALLRAVGDSMLGGRLNDQEMRSVTDNARAGQAARGNYLGDAAAVQEGIAQAAAGDAKQQQRLQNLMAIQGQAFGQSDALRNESQAARLARLGQLTGLQGQSFDQEQGLRNEDRASAAQQIGTLGGLAQQMFGNSQSVRQEQRAAEAQRFAQQQAAQEAQFRQQQAAYQNSLAAAGQAFGGTQAMAGDQRQAQQLNYGQQQQNLANASAVALGAPVTNQFGSLGGAQQGAVGFQGVNFAPVGQTNQNAGAQGANFAQGNFGTMANMWGQQAQIASQGNPWMSMLGNVAGAAGGAALGMMM